MFAGTEAVDVLFPVIPWPPLSVSAKITVGAPAGEAAGEVSGVSGTGMGPALAAELELAGMVGGYMTGWLTGHHVFCKAMGGTTAAMRDRDPMTDGMYCRGCGVIHAGGMTPCPFCDTTLNDRTLLDVHGPAAMVPLLMYVIPGVVPSMFGA